MSYGVCPGYGTEPCGWEGNLRSIRYRFPEPIMGATEAETEPMCLVCRHDFRRELREHGATEIRVTEVTSTT